MGDDIVLVLDVEEKPRKREWILLSLQHVLAMFGATVLVPILTGLPVSVALFASGVGTIIYSISTKRKSPVYLGSSFAYIVPIQTALAYNVVDGIPNYLAVVIGLVLTGLVYVVVATVIKFVGSGWIDKLLPPVVIGPAIMVIGLSLASSAVTNVGSDPKGIFVALFVVAVISITSVYAKGFMKLIPVFIGIVSGYLLAFALGMVDTSIIASAKMFNIPEFVLLRDGLHMLSFGDILAIALIFMPVSIVTITEHIGDHLVLSSIIDRDLLKDPGLTRTLIGDGVATAVSGLLGGPANTTYGENTGVIGITKVASVYVILGAAVIAIILSFFGYFIALIQAIPGPVIGGVGLILYGIIASSGVRVLINKQVDFSKQKNLVIAAVMLVSGIGGLTIGFLSSMATSVIIGIILNLILKDETSEAIE